jgi:C4-dicarboxylate-specific signal transduction histidine kinase
LSLCEDNQRLVEFIAASQSFFTREAGGRTRIPLNRFSSANELVAALLDPYSDRIQFSPAPVDFELRTNSYWLGVCLKNLVENALRYGEPPITVTLRFGRGKCSLRVEDQGTFGHAKPAGGLGMGLSITREIVKLLGGSIRMRKRPKTTLSIEIDP